MKNRYFSSLLPELATRATRATVSRLGFSNPALRAHLTELFSAGYGEKGCFLGDPVFEATFGWEEASAKMENLAPGLLAPSLVEALDKPGGGKSDDYRFPKTAHPYRHQLEAWNILCSEKPQSVVVTSGTGSGKTECFMVPILNQLAREYESRKSKLVGVEALFLYPLNALIQSQRERLDAWTANFGDGVRFCLYNGLTPQTEKQFHRDQTPNQVIDREALRAAPPPILVTNATMLEYMTCDELERNKQRRGRSPDEPGRIDNRMRFRELPSRDTVTALREYAPGSEVVIDGLVYRSAGITLNWHAPASVTDITEIQNIREAWRCRSCGSSGTSVRAKTIHECPDCGAALVPDPETRFTYLEPAGFSVDLYDSPHNDVSTQSFVPVASPWVNAQGEWLPLVNPGLGLYRSSNDGMVFNYSSGTKGHGYALCLTCGRAEPMDAADQLPAAFVDLKTGKPKEHNRLRGAQGGDSRVCEGSYNSFAVMPSLRLGHEAHTDVLELLLFGLDGIPLRDKQVAFTLAVALRNAIARLLGIESSELGCDTKPVKLAGNSVSQAIVIFDNNASGYCSSVADKLQQLFVMAKDELDCVNQCHDACQHCLLDFDTRFRSDDLNRHAALAFVSEDWMKVLALPEEYAYFGKAKSTAEYQSLPEAITREIATPSTKALRIYLAGDASDWDIAASPLRRWITRWAVAGNELQIVMPGKMASLLSPPDKSCLNSLCVLDGVSVWAGSPPACASGGYVAAELLRNEGSVAWATASVGMAMPAGAWGEPNGSTITRGTLSASGSLDHQLKLEAISPVPVSERTHRLELKNELDGPLIGFGKRLLSALEAELGGQLFSSSADIVEVTYHDRYLNSPLPVSLLLEFISGVKTVYADRWGVTKFNLMLSPFSEEPRPGMSPNKIWHNWPHPDARDRAIEAAFEFSGIEASVISRSKQDAIHARRLDFTLDTGDTVQIWFDQGCSYWQIPRSNPGAGRSWFPFDKSAEVQGEAIALADARVEGQAFPTYVFVGR